MKIGNVEFGTLDCIVCQSLGEWNQMLEYFPRTKFTEHKYLVNKGKIAYFPTHDLEHGEVMFLGSPEMSGARIHKWEELMSDIKSVDRAKKHIAQWGDKLEVLVVDEWVPAIFCCENPHTDTDKRFIVSIKGSGFCCVEPRTCRAPTIVNLDGNEYAIQEAIDELEKMKKHEISL